MLIQVFYIVLFAVCVYRRSGMLTRSDVTG